MTIEAILVFTKDQLRASTLRRQAFELHCRLHDQFVTCRQAGEFARARRLQRLCDRTAVRYHRRRETQEKLMGF